MQPVVLLALIAFVSSAAIKNDRRVLVLDKDTFTPFVTGNKHVLVQFCKLTESAVTPLCNGLYGKMLHSRASSGESFIYLIANSQMHRCLPTTNRSNLNTSRHLRSSKTLTLTSS